ncbi:hypothetical protein Tco_0373305 [Tanacetum coccineum]
MFRILNVYFRVRFFISGAIDMKYSHVIGFGIIRGYIYVYIIAWRPASLGYGLLQTPGARLTRGCTGISRTLCWPEEPIAEGGLGGRWGGGGGKAPSRQIRVGDQSYIADSDPKEDSEDGLVDYPADGGDDDDDDSSNNDEEEEAS